MLSNIFKASEAQVPSDALQKASEPQFPTDVLKIILDYLTHRMEYKELIPKSPDLAVWRERVPESLRPLFNIYKQRMVPPQKPEGSPQPKQSAISYKKAV